MDNDREREIDEGLPEEIDRWIEVKERHPPCEGLKRRRSDARRLKETAPGASYLFTN